MEVYIITDWDCGNRPMIVASSREKAMQQLFDYMGYDEKNMKNVIYKGFEEHQYSEEENQRSFIGTFTFDVLFAKKWETDKYHLYELTLDQLTK